MYHPDSLFISGLSKPTQKVYLNDTGISVFWTVLWHSQGWEHTFYISPRRNIKIKLTYFWLTSGKAGNICLEVYPKFFLAYVPQMFPTLSSPSAAFDYTLNLNPKPRTHLGYICIVSTSKGKLRCSLCPNIFIIFLVRIYFPSFKILSICVSSFHLFNAIHSHIYIYIHVSYTWPNS